MRVNCLLLIATYAFRAMYRNGLLFLIIFILSLFPCIIQYLLESTVFWENSILYHVRCDYPTRSMFTLPSFVPFVNALLFNIIQCFLIIFYCGNFFVQDKQVPTTQCMYARQGSNIEYVTGKSLGEVLFFLLLNAISCLVSMLVHVSFTSYPLGLPYHAFYLLTLTLPSALFFMGLTYFLKSVMKNAFLAQVVLLGVFYCSLVYFPVPPHHALDNLSLSLPNIFSVITGHPLPGIYLLNRTGYALLGIGLIFLAARFLLRPANRVPARVQYQKTSGTSIIIGLGLLVSVWGVHERDRRTRAGYLDTLVEHSNLPAATITRHDIAVERRDGALHLQSDLVISNRQANRIDSIVLNLNPGLEVHSVQRDGREIPFNREYQVLKIRHALPAGDSVTLSLRYSGRIDERICFIDIPDERYYSNANTTFPFIRFGSRYAYDEPSFTLLTPECLWYPTMIETRAFPFPSRQPTFTRFSLKVTRPEGMEVISQGRRSVASDTVYFENRNKLPGISLCVGDYRYKMERLDGVDYELFHLDEDYSIAGYLANFSHPNVQKGIRAFRGGLEKQNGKYLFDKFVAIEVPVSFSAHERVGRSGVYAQPEMTFQPELRCKYMERSLGDKVEKPSSHFSYLCSAITRMEQGRYSLNSLFSDFAREVRLNGSPLGNYMLRALQKPQKGSFFQGVSSEWISKAEMLPLLENYSLSDIVREVTLPVADVNRFLEEKSLELQNILLRHTSWDALHEFIQQYLLDNRFTVSDFDDFLRQADSVFRFDSLTRPYLQTWSTRKGVPAYKYKCQAAYFRKENGSPQTVCIFTILNAGTADGLLTFQNPFNDGSSAAYSLQRGGNPPFTYLLKKGECKQFKLIGPHSVGMNSARNIPLMMMYNWMNPVEIPPLSGHTITPGDTSLFSLPADEIVVDDRDAGFEFTESNKLGAFFYASRNKHKYKIDPQATLWTPVIKYYYHGDFIKSAHVKLAMNSSARAAWNVTLPEAGEYEIFVSNVVRRRHYKTIPPVSQYYTLESDRPTRIQVDGDETIIVTITDDRRRKEVLEEERETEKSWVSLGKHNLPKGTVKLVLHDKGRYDQQPIVADAVKFKRVK